MVKLELEVEEEDEEMGRLCEDVVEIVLDRIPIRPLIRMKCLSKRWFRLISHYRQSRPRPASSTVLVVTYKSIENNVLQVAFLDAKDDPGEIKSLENNSLGFSIPNARDIGFCSGASNGLLLWTSFYPPRQLQQDQLQFHICNPKLNHWVSLPRLTTLPGYSSGWGLAFDGEPHHHYKLVCFPLNSFRIVSTGYLEFHVFSSQTATWRNHKATVLNSSLLLNEKLALRHWVLNSCLFRKGRLHWVLPDCRCMMVYNLHEEEEGEGSFMLMKLPLLNQIEDVRPHSESLWESEGRLHYSYTHFNKIHILTLNDDELYTKSAQKEWQMRITIEFETLKAQHPYINEEVDDVFDSLSTCGFNEDLQIVCIQFDLEIFTYSLETRRFDMAWRYTTGEQDRDLFCMQLRETDIPIGGGTQLLHPNTDSQIAGRPRLLL